MHISSQPAILYFGTPVVLITTLNEDNTYNLAPMSSVFWLGWRCILGLSTKSKTTQNMIRTGECVLNLPSVDEVAAVNKLARTTGSYPVPDSKVRRGYRYEPDKFGFSGLTPIRSETVTPLRVHECPVQLEAVIEATHGIADEDSLQRGNLVSIEVRVQRIHIEETIMMEQEPNRVDPNRWRPLIMSFQEFYGLGPKLQHSTLGEIPEFLYRSPDVHRANAEESRDAL